MANRLVHEDVCDYFQKWGSNEKATPAQRHNWSQDKLSIDMLGNDDTASLKLLEEDQGDGQTVGSLTTRTARLAFADSDRHIWLPDLDLIRLGVFLHLDWIQILVLVIKAQWERFWANSAVAGGDETGSLFVLLKRASIDGASIEAFKPGLYGTAGCEKLHEMLGQFGLLPDLATGQLSELIKELILAGLHLKPNDGPEIWEFIGRQRQQAALLCETSKETAADWWIKKSIWLDLQQQIANLLFHLEERRLYSANLNWEWNRVFGKLFVGIKELEFRLQFIEDAIALKKEQPKLNLVEVEQMVGEKRREESLAMENLQKDLAFSLNYKPLSGSNMDPEEKRKYKSKCKAILRKIWQLTHDDRIANKGFTEAQLDQLRSSFRKATQIKEWEIGFKYRSLVDLEEILESVEAVWQYLGVDVHYKMILKGDTLDDQMVELEKRIFQLEKEKTQIKEELFLHINSEVVREKQTSLESEKNIKKVKRDLALRKRALKEKFLAHEKVYHGLFGHEKLGLTNSV